MLLCALGQLLFHLFLCLYSDFSGYSFAVVGERMNSLVTDTSDIGIPCGSRFFKPS